MDYITIAKVFLGNLTFILIVGYIGYDIRVSKEQRNLFELGIVDKSEFDEVAKKVDRIKAMDIIALLALTLLLTTAFTKVYMSTNFKATDLTTSALAIATLFVASEIVKPKHKKIDDLDFFRKQFYKIGKNESVTIVYLKKGEVSETVVNTSYYELLYSDGKTFLKYAPKVSRNNLYITSGRMINVEIDESYFKVNEL